MNYFLIADLNGSKRIFGQGNTMQMAWVAGRWNANEGGATNLRALPENKLPKGIKWYDEN